jgi:hypothetical protein
MRVRAVHCVITTQTHLYVELPGILQAAEIVSEAQSRRGYIRTPATSEQVTHRRKSQMGLVPSLRKMGLGPKLTDRRQCAVTSAWLLVMPKHESLLSLALSVTPT